MLMSCYVCGLEGPKSPLFGTGDSEKTASKFLLDGKGTKELCDVLIYLGTFGLPEAIPCCQDCFRIGKRWAGPSTGFHKSTDFDHLVRKQLPHVATIQYLRYLPDGDLGDMGRPTKVEHIRKTKTSGILTYDYTMTLTTREMRDGEWIQVPKPADTFAADWEYQRQVIRPEYTRPRWVLEEFVGVAHSELRAGTVVMNGNIRVDWKGNSVRTGVHVQLIAPTGQTAADGTPIWIAEDYESKRERAVKTLQLWWRAEYSLYEGPKHGGRKLGQLQRQWPRLRAYQGTFECALCGGYTTNERIQQEGAECKLCTGWTIDERYCIVCDGLLDGGGSTSGCPGCTH